MYNWRTYYGSLHIICVTDEMLYGNGKHYSGNEHFSRDNPVFRLVSYSFFIAKNIPGVLRYSISSAGPLGPRPVP